MAKKLSGAKTSNEVGASGGASVPASREQSRRATAREDARPTAKPAKPSALLDTRVVYCGDNLESLAKLPDACVDLIYIEADAFFRRSGKSIVLFTVQEILEEHLAKKLA